MPGFILRWKTIRTLRKRGYILAIKFVRTKRKWGLRKAKDYVDRIVQDIGWERPSLTERRDHA